MEEIRYFILFLCIMSCMTGCHRNAAITELKHSPIPQLRISMDAAFVDTIYNVNRKKVPAYAVLVMEGGDTIYDDSLKYIRARGNSTFDIPSKKAFTIKFANPVRIPGVDKGKKFILLANALDEGLSHVRNSIAFDIAQQVGMLAPAYTYISLYINEDYKGLYQMTRTVDVNKRFVNIVDLEKENEYLNGMSLDIYEQFCYGDINQQQIKGFMLPNTPDDFTGGYLLRIGGYSRAESGFMSRAGDTISIKSPQHASLAEVKYIQAYYNQMEDAIRDTTTSRYLDYIDVVSFAKYYMLQEILVNSDACVGNSIYLYKDAHGKMNAGPIWDMDGILTPDNKARYTYDLPANMIWAAEPKSLTQKPKSLLQLLWEREDFREVCKEVYLNQMSEAIHKYINSGYIDSLSKLLADEAVYDYSVNGYESGYNEADYKESVSIPMKYLKERIDFFDWYFNTAGEDMVCLSDVSELEMPQDRNIHMYVAKGEPIMLPARRHVNVRTPNVEWYIAGTNERIKDGMIIDRDCDIECRLVPPSWWEKQYRRVKKLIH